MTRFAPIDRSIGPLIAPRARSYRRFAIYKHHTRGFTVASGMRRPLIIRADNIGATDAVAAWPA